MYCVPLKFSDYGALKERIYDTKRTYTDDDGPLLVLNQKQGIQSKETLLHQKLQDLQNSKKHRSKYEYFYYLLCKYSISRRYIWKVKIRRGIIYTFLVCGKHINLSMRVCYLNLVLVYIPYQFLTPARNPAEINCVLPPAFLTNGTSTLHFQKNDTIALLFTPVTVRTTLMWVSFAFYLLIFAVSHWAWFRSESREFDSNPGMHLLQNIGPMDVQDMLKIKDGKIQWANTDLQLIMSLVYVNRDRLKYIE